jgi:phenylpropionate dioxygenase-like ring-hydroxylating dioxygenase large terminal subunit
MYGIHKARVDQERALRAAGLVDTSTGLVGREIFNDDEIYQIELERIFGRCWLYLAHESQIPNPNDYVNVFMGMEPVLVCRNRHGGLSAFINSCRHRGAPVCRADQGNTRSFVCPYHGWTYDTSGALVHVPGEENLYHKEIDKPEWGLARVAQVASYNGLIFGAFDPEAPSLEEYLGDMRWGIDLLLMQGDLVAVPGVARWVMDANWKFAADNAIGDMYHGGFTHKSAVLAGHNSGTGTNRGGNVAPHDNSKRKGITVITEYGHGFNANFPLESEVDYSSALAAWRRNPDVQKNLGPVRQRINRANMNVFPNLFMNSGSRELMLRNPLGPGRIEIWKTILVDKNADPEIQRNQIRASNRHFGPAGMFEQDDGENWAMSTRGVRAPVTRRYDLNYAMGRGHGDVVAKEDDTPAHVATLVNEHAQLWLYRCWSEYMTAASWPELKQTHSRPEGVL